MMKTETEFAAGSMVFFVAPNHKAMTMSIMITAGGLPNNVCQTVDPM